MKNKIKETFTLPSETTMDTPYGSITIVPSKTGLKFTPDKNFNMRDFQSDLEDKGDLEMWAELWDKLTGNGWTLITPEQIGALTSDPFIVGYDVAYESEDDMDIIIDGAIYNYPDYAILSPLEQLIKRKEFTLSLTEWDDSEEVEESAKKSIKEEEGELSYETASPIIKDIVTEAYEDVLSASNIEFYPYKASETVEELEHKSRDGFWSWIDGGWGAKGFISVSSLIGGGYTISEKIGKELDRLLKDANEDAEEQYGRKYEELTTDEEREEYYAIQDQWYEDLEMMLDIAIQFYNPDNSHGTGQEDEFSAHVVCGINWDYDYFRSDTKNWDGKVKDVSFKTLDEMKSKLESAIKEVITFIVAKKETPKPETTPVEESFHYAFYDKGNKDEVIRVFSTTGELKEGNQLPFYKRDLAKYKKNLKCIALTPDEYSDLKEAIKVETISLTSLIASRLRENEEDDEQISLSPDEISRAIDTEEFDYYSFAASYFINGDHSGLSDEDQKEADEFLEWIGKDGYRICVDASEESFFGKPDGGGLAGDLLTYTFQRTGSTPDGGGRKPHGEMDESSACKPSGKIKEGAGGGYTLYARCEVEIEAEGGELTLPESLELTENDAQGDISRGVKYYKPKWDAISLGTVSNFKFKKEDLEELSKQPYVYFRIGDTYETGLTYTTGSTMHQEIASVLKNLPCMLDNGEQHGEFLIEGTCDLTVSEDLKRLDKIGSEEEFEESSERIEFTQTSISKKDLPEFISELKRKYNEAKKK